MDVLLSEQKDHAMTLLANGWVAVHTVNNEFRINNGPPEDMAIIDRLLEQGLVMQSNDRAYVAAVCPLPGQRL
jgi:predicted transcriptional regulator